MPRYPTTPKAYPGTPKAYPGTPNAYPSTVLSYPPGSWSPADSSFTKLWFDPSLLTGTQGDPVDSLPNLGDQSFLTAIAATGSQRPTLRQIRGRNALKFVQASAQRLEAVFLAGSFSHPIYTFIVHCANDPRTTTTLCSGAPGSADSYRIRATASTWPRGHAIVGSATLTKASTTRCDQPVALMALKNGASSVIRLNGFSDTTGTSGTVSMTGFGIGIDVAGTNGYGGCIGEVIVTQGALTAADEALYLGYLEEKWFTKASRRQLLCLGDSNTAGTGVTLATAGYRNFIETWGQGAPGGFFYDFIGPAQMTTLANSNHDGVNGTTIQNHIDGTGGATAIATLLASQYLPDYIVLHIGTNDCNNAADVIAATSTAYDNLMTTIRGASTAKVAVCSIIDQGTGAQQRLNVNGVNANLPALIAAQNTAAGFTQFTLIGTNAAVGQYPTNYQDTLHMNQTGASLFADVVKAYLLAN